VLQATQVAPPVPQAVLEFPVWQWLFASQQPFGQLAAVQIQSPFWHCWPATHSTQTIPLLPQNWLLVPG
jgi:hypothetical protein